MVGINAQTLRRYENLGIIHPERSKENNYRLYEWRDFVQLLRIRSLRNYGFGLQEIENLYQSTATEAAALFETRISDLEEEIQKLQRQQQLVQKHRDRLSGWQKLWDEGYVMYQRPEAIFYPYRRTRTEDVVDKEMSSGIDDVTRHMPPLRSGVLVWKDPETGQQITYSGLYAFAEELETAPEGGIRVPGALCLMTAVMGDRSKDYRSAMAPERSFPLWNEEYFSPLLEKEGYGVSGMVLTEVLHMCQLPEEKGDVPMMRFRSYLTSWIPIIPLEQSADMSLKIKTCYYLDIDTV